MGECWGLAGRCSGAHCTDAEMDWWGSDFARLAIISPSCNLREIDPDGSLRLHEVEVSPSAGMILPITPVVAKRERHIMYQLLCGMTTNAFTPYPSGKWVTRGFEACRIAYDLGAPEPQGTRLQIAPGSLAYHSSFNSLAYVVCPDFAKTRGWLGMIDPNQ